VRRRTLGEQLFRVQARVKDGRVRARRFAVEAILNLGITLRQANDGGVSILG
jgi:hypothetical protein